MKPLVRLFGLAILLALAAPTALAHDTSQGHGSGIAAVSRGDDIPFALGGPWSLIDHTGQPRTREDFCRQYRIIYFGYTSCPYSCSTAAANIATVLDGLADGGDVMGALYITIDPTFDTPERLADFVPRIHPRMLGLTGAVAEIERLQKSFQVHAQEAADKGGTSDCSTISPWRS